MLSKGCSLDTLGLVTALYSMFIVIFEFPSGIIADIIGQKKIYVISLILSMIGYSVVLINNNIIWLFVGFSLYGTARAFSSGSVEVLFINQYIHKNGKENLHKLISILGSGEIAGLATGALLGGVIPLVWQKLFPDQNKYNGNLVAQIFIILILTIITLLFVKETKNTQNEKKSISKHTSDSIKFVFNNKNVLFIVFGTMIWGFSFNALELYWQPKLESMLGGNSTTWVFGIINSGYFVASLIGVGIVNILIKKKQIKSNLFLFSGRIIIGILFIILSIQSKVLSFSALYLFQFMINGMTGIPESTLLNSQIPDDKRSSLLSFNSLMMQLGGIAGSMLYSSLVNTLQISGIWILAGIIFAVSGVLYLKIKT
jgi:MFS family permease